MKWLKEIDYGLVLPAMARLPAALAYRAADWRGDLTWLLRRDARRHAVRNLQATFPQQSPDEARRTVRQQYRTLAHDEMESYWFGRPLSFFEPRIRITGLDDLKASLESGQGVLLYTAHLGSTGFCLTVLGKMGFPINLVFRSLDEVPGMPRSWYRYGKARIRRLEAAVRRPVIQSGRTLYFSMRRKLRQGEIVLMGLDVVPGYVKKTVTVDFLGKPCAFPEGLARLCLDTGARPVLWSIHQDSRRMHHAELQDISSRLKGLDDKQQVTQVLVHGIEQRIRRHPEDWLLWDSLTHFQSAANPQEADLAPSRKAAKSEKA